MSKNTQPAKKRALARCGRCRARVLETDPHGWCDSCADQLALAFVVRGKDGRFVSIARLYDGGDR